MLAAPALLLALASAASGPTIDDDAFRQWFQAAARGQLRLPAAVAEKARGFRYVFVGGFANELTPGYFAQTARALQAHGVAQTAVHFIFPSSQRTIDENGEDVAAQLRKIAAEGAEPLVIVGHSRGAADALAFALRHPSFVRDRVYALFLIQGAFGGSGAADYVLGEGPSMDEQMPFRLRVLAQVIARAEQSKLRQGKHDGLAGLTRSGCSEFWEQMRVDCADAIPDVAPKTFYITSKVEPSRLRLFRRAVATYLDTYYGPNDGIVCLEDQSLPELGTCLVVPDVGHTDLTHRFPAGHGPRRLRQALADSIVMAVGQTTDDEDNDGEKSAPRTARKRQRIAPDDRAGEEPGPPKRRLRRAITPNDTHSSIRRAPERDCGLSEPAP